MNKAENFIRRKIQEDLDSNRVSCIHTRFPPEPNGYLHIGHAKSITLNFGIMEVLPESRKALCNLRFDDTNPEAEDTEYIDSIKQDLRWLGYDWQDREYYASDYFQQLYEYAVLLINKGLAYVDHSSVEEIKTLRGTPTETGTESKYRNRSIEENLALFEQMKQGYIQEGACILRAKIDMSHPNLVMRDPPIYRIRELAHHRSGRQWRIYPMYDYAHCLSDAIEGITHSLCTLEFEIHRPLYEWFIKAADIPQPHPVQIEFARLNISHTVLSKRKTKQLVDEGYVDGWNDPRMPTLAGLRRRGYTPEAIIQFCEEVGITKTNSVIELARLEEALRQELHKHSPRVMTVFDPIVLVIDNYPEGAQEMLSVANNPMHPELGTHTISFGRELFIEREDAMEDPPKGYHRLCIGQEVRLQYAYYVTCTNIVKDDEGNIIRVHVEYDQESRGGQTADKRKVKGTIHWVDCNNAVAVRVNMLDTLFTEALPEQQDKSFIEYVNSNSRKVNDSVVAEAYIAELIKSYADRDAYPLQSMRKCYIMYDAEYSAQCAKPVFNFTVSLKDSWKRKN